MRIAVLTSGGVDSSVALRLLEEQDHQVTAFYLKIWLDQSTAHLGQASCPWEEDLEHIRNVCREAYIDFEVLSMGKAYYEKVVEETITEVRAGRTPNPDVFCNNRIKFGLFLNQITGFDQVATGHYAQTRKVHGKTHLVATPDAVKDQTYFLAGIPSHKLETVVFPIGHLMKPQVRQLARVYNLSNQSRKDSQGICFLGKLKYSDFLKHYLGVRPGIFLEEETNQKLGVHQGFWFYTPGQRHGIGLGGGPWYVVRKNPEEDIVYISRRYQEVIRRNFLITDCNWFSGEPPVTDTLEVKLRHGPFRHRCKLRNSEVILESQDQGIAEGQIAVFYDQDLCLGSGRIIHQSEAKNSSPQKTSDCL